MEIKYCKDCNTELVVGETWYISQFKQSNYRCISCHKKKTKKWIHDNNWKHQKFVEKNKISIPSGIYGIIKDKKLIYIGESKYPYRRIVNHFANRTNLNSAHRVSPISYAISTGKLKRKDLSFMMLEYIDDTNTRKKRERELIREKTPKYNLAT